MNLTIFFFNDTATTEIYTLSLHDALPISATRTCCPSLSRCAPRATICSPGCTPSERMASSRSEEHTSELQSHLNLVCRLLLEKKKENSALGPRRPAAEHEILERMRTR